MMLVHLGAAGDVERDAGDIVGLGQEHDGLADIVGTSLDSADELDRLTKLPPEKQRDLIDRARSGEEEPFCLTADRFLDRIAKHL